METPSHCCPTCGSLLRDQQAHVDLNTNTFVLRDQQVQLMPRMAELLEVLLRRAPAVVPHETIWVQLYGTVSEPQDMQRAITTCICRLRDVLRPLGADIQNVARVGYRFVSDVEAVHVRKPSSTLAALRVPALDPVWRGMEGRPGRKKTRHLEQQRSE
jgi:DNA-binding winged helix-turn-helix (wHTH) protein